MQVLQAGDHKFVLLELDPELVAKIAKQSGFACKLDDGKRRLVAELTTRGRQSPLLLFDAADPANLGWFSRCQFYVDGRTGTVLQTPISIANLKDPNGQPLPQAIKMQIAKELPASFCLPGKQPVTEQLVYSVLANFLNALTHTGVGVCGGPAIRPLAGRTDGVEIKN